MKNFKIVSKILFYFFFASISIWIGSTLVKTFVFYNMFQPEQNLPLKTYLMIDKSLNIEVIKGILFTIYPITLITFASFISACLFLILTLVIERPSLKEQGWLFITCVLVFLLSPFEIYLMNFDYKLLQLIPQVNYDANIAIELIRNRLSKLNTFPMVELFSFIGILYFLIFQPLTHKIKKNNDNN